MRRTPWIRSVAHIVSLAVAGCSGSVPTEDDAGADAGHGDAAFVITTVSGTLSEAGGTATFTVQLAHAPTSDVAIPVSSSDVTEGTVAPSALVFHPSDWNVPQTVTLTSADDDLVDGFVAWSVVLGPAQSNGSDYKGFDPADIATNTSDDDQAGVVIGAPVDGTVLDTTGDTTTFTVRLAAEPTSMVTIPLSAPSGLVAPSPSALVFQPNEWATPKTVTVTSTGANVAADTTISVVLGTIASADPWFGVIDPADVLIGVEDAEDEALVVSAVGGGALVTPLATHETGLSTTFAVRLSRRPSGSVTVSITASDTNEVTITGPTLTFDESTFSTPQTVSITGHGDGAVDGNASFDLILTPTGDPGFARLSPTTIAVVNSAGSIDYAENRIAVVAGCAPNQANCPGTDSPLDLTDGDAGTEWIFGEGVNGSCSSCTDPRPARPYATLDLVSNLPTAQLTLTCTSSGGAITVPIPSLSVSSDGVAFAPLAYTSGAPVSVPTGTRYVRMTAGEAELRPLVDFWASELRCSGLSVVVAGDI